MNFLSVCSGIEAASVAWAPLGWRAVGFSEIEPFPCAVLAHHYPDVPNFGDMTKFKDWPDDLSVDLLCGGTPCQSFSVAGLRKGLDDPRGNLMLTYAAIAAKYRPKWLVWENVPGVLSSNGGRDFGALLWLLGELGYGYAYRVLDAQYFGVAQRRRRVFVVGCFGDWRAAAAVLFERHSLQGHPAPRRQTGKAAPTIPSRSTAGGGLGTDFDCDGGLIVGTLQASGKAAGSATQQDAECGLLVAHSLRGEGFDASEDGTGRGTPLVPVAYATKLHNTTSNQAGKFYENYTASLDANSPPPAVVFDTTQITSEANYSNPKPGDPCHPLAAGAHPPAIAFDWRAGGDTACGTSLTGCPPLRTTDTVAVAFQERGRQDGRALEVGGDVAYTLTAPNGGGRAQERNVMTPTMQVRRLTPRECERLQGFPDDYTAVPHRGKHAADGPRYKALGNSWAVPNVRWIGRRIEAVQAIT